MGFAAWLNTAFPSDERLGIWKHFWHKSSEILLNKRFFTCNARVSYCREICAGPQLLRPYHLCWRADFGLSSMIEPDVLLMLAELYLSEGWLSCHVSCSF